MRRDDPEPGSRPTVSAEAVQCERRGSGLWLRLNRPHALNALNTDVTDGLNRGLDQAEEDQIRAVVIAGQGRAFCAGADLKQVLDAESGLLDRLGAVFDRVDGFGKPVIAAVQGPALAGGLELVLCCDLVVASRSAAFGDAHANYGMFPAGGATVRLPRRVGVARAKQLMFTGVTLPAEKLAGTDLITSLVEGDELDGEVGALVAAIAGKSAAGITVMKALVDEGMQVPREVALRRERREAAAYIRSADFAEGIRAFAEKRRPRFSGSVEESR
jgi:enoyl-CoA hydratase/carnithine racemase